MTELLEIVIPKFAAQWNSLAYFLEFEVSRVEIIRKQHLSIAIDLTIKLNMTDFM